MRERILLNDNWRFYGDDIKITDSVSKGQAYSQAKTERYLYGPASRLYPDTPDDYGDKQRLSTELKWENVDLPHDYIINRPYDENENNAWGFKKYTPAWYRKHFAVPSCDKDKRIVLYFEGVADIANVYFNGCELYINREGHTPFEVDITDYVRFDSDNVIAIRVEAGTGEGWWYLGGGIYRNVWLEKYDKVAIDRYGVCVMPEFKNNKWQVPIEVTVRNDDYVSRKADISVECEALTNSLKAEIEIGARSTETVKLIGYADDPESWDIDDPKLYGLTVRVESNDDSDEMTVNTGFRIVEMRADTGLWLNGRNIKLKGVCAHGDNGLTGLAVDEAVIRYKAKLIKEMGANAFRSSHYPHAESWLDEMDKLGILVMDETRWFSSSKEGIEQLRTLIKRDRNHPSVIMWSIGNEEPFFVTENGARIARNLYFEAKRLDKRPVLTANDKAPEIATVYEYSDIVGVNYNMGLLDRLHEKYPDKPVLSTENAATGTTRGWYYDNVPELGRINAFDHDTNESFIGRERVWNIINDRPWLMGGMQWIAFEHRGEAAWPRVCSASGAIDLFLQKKDAFYQNQAYWDNKPMVHILPSWTRIAANGEKVRVWAYSNCDEVELFINGRSEGRKQNRYASHTEWDVGYEEGMIECVGYIDGQIAARDARVSAGEPFALKLIPENINDIRKGEVLILTCVIVDKDGNEVEDAENTITVFTNASGRIIATGADNTDHVPQNIPVRKAYMGRVSIACRTGLDEKPLKITAISPNLASAKMELDI